MKEIGDRIDGKPKQATEISGPDGNPIRTEKVEWTILPVTPMDKVDELPARIEDQKNSAPGA